MVAEPRPELRPHSWLVLSVGRICRECMLVLARDEQDDNRCPGGRPDGTRATDWERRRDG
jgi:hypothetical protein